jgi:hypothetical protein
VLRKHFECRYNIHFYLSIYLSINSYIGICTAKTLGFSGLMVFPETKTNSNTKFDKDPSVGKAKTCQCAHGESYKYMCIIRTHILHVHVCVHVYIQTHVFHVQMLHINAQTFETFASARMLRAECVYVCVFTHILH